MKQEFDIAPFVALGVELRCSLHDGLPSEIVAGSIAENGWFTPETVTKALEALANDMLTEETLSRWLSAYAETPLPKPGNVAVIMAGNVPAAGFFDLMCILLCGHRALIKPSSKDRILIEWLCNLSCRIEPRFSVSPLGNQKPDVVIATGSDAARRHFETVYACTPALLRGNRHSIAVLTGEESGHDLQGLADDIFLYFGLGCRNVSRLFLPHGYDAKLLIEILQHNPLILNKYLNGYRQARTLCLMNGEPFADGGFFLLRERDSEPETLSEIACTRYGTLDEVEAWITAHDYELQCVVSKAISHPRRADFGQAQHPRPWDYPDGADVIQFLLNIV